MREHGVLALGIVVAATIFGVFFHASRTEDRSVRVVGAATQRFSSDIVKWRITINRTVSPAERNGGYDRIREDLRLVRETLAARGIADSAVSIQPVNAYPTMGQQGNVTGYSINQSLFVISSLVEEIEALALNPAVLVEKGVLLQSSNLEYHSTRLSDLKRILLAEATKDARRRADEIAANAGMAVAHLLSARAGVFQINEPYSTEVSDYGIFNPSSKTKDITVTVNATFALE
jgi:hypothetical protein